MTVPTLVSQMSHGTFCRHQGRGDVFLAFGVVDDDFAAALKALNDGICDLAIRCRGTGSDVVDAVCRAPERALDRQRCVGCVEEVSGCPGRCMEVEWLASPGAIHEHVDHVVIGFTGPVEMTESQRREGEARSLGDARSDPFGGKFQDSIRP